MSIKKHRAEKLIRRSRGYEPLPKSVFNLLKGEFNLSSTDFICYMYIYCNLTDFGKYRGIEYGTFDYTNEEIASALGYSSPTISRSLTKLKKCKLIFKNENDLMEVTAYRFLKRYLTEKSTSKRYIPFIEAINFFNSKNIKYTEADFHAVLNEIDMTALLDKAAKSIKSDFKAPP